MARKFIFMGSEFRLSISLTMKAFEEKVAQPQCRQRNVYKIQPSENVYPILYLTPLCDIAMAISVHTGTPVAHRLPSLFM